MTSANINQNNVNKNVVRWLYFGVFMLLIQILLGGITRLTESGLSITEWKPITGALPPLNLSDWQVEFDKYKNTDQFRYIHSDFTLSDFKTIFFWEWFHRTWARLMGLVFLAGFFYFLIKKQLKKEMVIPFIILFILGIIQGAIGWIMVASGLVPEKMFVGHIQLATHFMAALLLLCYTLWFALKLSVPEQQKIQLNGIKKWTWTIFLLLFFQLIYGAFMAGLHAATVAPTWPSINGEFIPHLINDLSPSWRNIFDNPITVQFIHRTFAYLLLLTVIIWWIKTGKIHATKLFRQARSFLLFFILLQITLGIFTVVNSPYGDSLVWFGVLHQLVGILFLMTVVFIIFLSARKTY